MRGYVNSEELVMKFYSSHEDGERALQKQSDISKILNRESTVNIVKGCALRDNERLYSSRSEIHEQAFGITLNNGKNFV